MTRVKQETFQLTPLTMAIFEYYSWKKSLNKTTLLRGLLTAFPRFDPEFDFDEFEWFVNKVVKPALKKTHPDAVAELMDDTKRFRERPHTSHTTMFFNTAPPTSSSTSDKDMDPKNIAIKVTKATAKTKKRKRPSSEPSSLADRVMKWGKK